MLPRGNCWRALKALASFTINSQTSIKISRNKLLAPQHIHIRTMSSVVKNEFNQPIGPSIAGWNGAKPITFDNQLPVQGRTCSLVPMDADTHTQSLYDSFALDDGSMWTYLSIGPFSKPEELRDELVGRFTRSSELVCYVVICSKTQKAVGMLSYLRVFPTSGSIEIGWVTFSPLLRKSTMATEAIYLLINQAFESGYRRVEWKCDNLNEKSQRAARRFGFEAEGIHRNATVYKMRSRDTAWFSIVQDEWDVIKKRFEAWLDPRNFDKDGKQVYSLNDGNLVHSLNVESR